MANMFPRLVAASKIARQVRIAVKKESQFIIVHQATQQQCQHLVSAMWERTVAQVKHHVHRALLANIKTQQDNQAVRIVVPAHTAVAPQMQHVPNVRQGNTKMKQGNHPVSRVTTDITKMKQGNHHARIVQMVHIHRKTQ
jgi:hypothetical protein